MINVRVTTKGECQCDSCTGKLVEGEKKIAIGTLILCDVCVGYVNIRLNDIIEQSQSKVLGRNSLCSCGSGYKYKHCCLI